MSAGFFFGGDTRPPPFCVGGGPLRAGFQGGVSPVSPLVATSVALVHTAPNERSAATCNLGWDLMKPVATLEVLWSQNTGLLL